DYGIQRRVVHPFSAPEYLVIFDARVGIDLCDGRARQDVVKLVEEDALPAFAQLTLPRRTLRWITQRTCRGRPQLGLAIEQLRQAVGPLDPALAGVGAAMVLQVELADPRRKVGIRPDALVQAAEEFLGRALLDAREPGQRGQARRRLLHRVRGAAAPVAKPEQVEQLVVNVFLA